MATFETTYLGHFRTEIKHLASGSKTITDAPKSYNGLGEHFSPPEMAAAALGSCIMTITAISIEKSGVDIKGTRMVIDVKMNEEPKRLGEVKIDIYFPRDFDDKTKAIIKNAAASCPVARSLHPDVKQIVNFHYGK